MLAYLCFVWQGSFCSPGIHFFYERNLLQGFLYHCFHLNKLMVLALLGVLLCMERYAYFCMLHCINTDMAPANMAANVGEFTGYRVLLIFSSVCQTPVSAYIICTESEFVICYWLQNLDQPSCANGFLDTACQCIIQSEIQDPGCPRIVC